MLQDDADLRDIQVPVKIIRVGGSELSEMVTAVSRSANSQNTVQPADFSANEPFHVAVEKSGEQRLDSGWQRKLVLRASDAAAIVRHEWRWGPTRRRATIPAERRRRTASSRRRISPSTSTHGTACLIS